MEFLAEFLVHEVTSTLPYIAKPALAIRLMDFPTLIIDGRVEERLVFGKGKACKFKLEPTEFRQALQRLPLYVMLMDVYAPNIKMLATAALDLSVFAEGDFSRQTQFRRSRVDLFDPVRNAVAKVDISISFLQVPESNAEITSKPPDSIFKAITEEEIRHSARSIKETASMGVETEPLPQPAAPTKVTFSKGTMTQDPAAAPCSVQTETSVFNQVYQPPPMFLTKPSKYTPREVPREQSLPVQPRPQIRPTSREGLLEDLISELISLKERSKVPSMSYPPVMHFEQKPTSPVVLSTQKVANIDIIIPPHFDQSPIPTNRSKESVQPAKVSTDEYSDDFEEDRSSSIRTSQSAEQTIRCYLCGEVLKIAEASAHNKKCKKSRLKDSVSMSPRSSIEEQIEASHVSRVDKSISQTSMIQEYEEDFEEASSSLK